jgi:tellurite resistance protein
MTVAGFDLPGLVYVGRVLKRSDGYGRNDNCLIDPGLTVSRSNADTIGQHMDYWPAYESMRPSSRRAFLEWLSGGRSDPDTYVGYVFVYLYGLERRGVLERSREDRPAIRAEVERLIAVYGHHDSFRRYAGELLAALDILDLEPGRDPAPVFLPSGGNVPPAVCIAVGSRIRDGRPVEADWLLAWTMSHPETRVRTPARRAFDHLRAEFAVEFDRRHPSGGLLLKAGKGKAAPIQYRAASGSFTIGIEPDGMDALPDLSRFPKALATGRELLEICTDGLDAYSRQLAKGGAVTLRALALLPPGRRERTAGQVAGEDLDWLRAHASSGVPVPFHDLGGRISGQPTDKATPARLRDLGDTLCRFGMGLIPDPRFPARLPPSLQVMLFRLDAPREAVEAPSDAYKAAFLALSVGMLVAKADGEVDEDERTVLRDLASASPDLLPDERRRLVADALWLETHPTELPTLRARLSELGPDHRQAVGATLVRVASSDGSHHRAEIALLEKAFRHMGLDQNQLYAALHQAAPTPRTSGATQTGADDPVRVASGAEYERTYAIPGAPASPARPPLPRPSTEARSVASGAPASGQTTPSSMERVDAERLAAIRAETMAVSSVLSDVFDLDAEGPPSHGGTIAPVKDPEDTEGTFSGLDPRHAQLLRELVARPDWPRAEFDRLAREFGLMPGAAMENLNAWAFDRFDDLLVEEGDPVHVNLHLIPDPLSEAA